MKSNNRYKPQVMTDKTHFLYVPNCETLEDAEICAAKKLIIEQKLKDRQVQRVKLTNDESGSLKPKLFKSRSNKHTIKNALIFFIFAVRTENITKDEILDILERSPHNHYLLHFSDRSNFRLLFRGLYYLDQKSGVAIKIYGSGPDNVSGDNIKSVYTYVHSTKEFRIIEHSKSISIACDAFSIIRKL
ncbi:hypothetical protein HZS_1374, partial [Henneguya salminicola]